MYKSQYLKMDPYDDWFCGLGSHLLYDAVNNVSTVELNVKFLSKKTEIVFYYKTYFNNLCLFTTKNRYFFVWGKVDYET